jgi:hypothetical protein
MEPGRNETGKDTHSAAFINAANHDFDAGV